MPNAHVRFIEAEDSHVDALLDMVRAYYTGERYPFHEAEARRALHDLLIDKRLGRVWLIHDECGTAGYMALTFGYSIEYLGVDAFIDELFIKQERRGRGLGAAAVAFALERCRDLGVNAVHLEVERNKTSAREMYRSFGFEDHDRRLITRQIKPRAASRGGMSGSASVIARVSAKHGESGK